MTSSNIERQIVIGMIASTSYLEGIRGIYSPRYLESSLAKRMATWCIEHFDKYGKAPERHIADIYFEKLAKGLPQELGNEIEEDILPALSDEYTTSFDEEYLLDATQKYFAEQHLHLHTGTLEAFLEEGDIETAQAEASEFIPLAKKEGEYINFSNAKVLQQISKAFADTGECLIQYPKQLGEFWNHQLVRGGFVALQAPEKRGKTFLLMDMARRAVRQGSRVAFFQAGDMTQSQQLRRFCINLTGKSDLAKYCDEHWEPVRDCVYNQINQCDRMVRECPFGVFEDKDPRWVREEVAIEDIKQAYREEPEYRACHNCLEYQQNNWGATWMRRIPSTSPLEETEALAAFERYYVGKKNLMLSSHANGTLTVHEMKSLLSIWAKEGFVPDVIIIDYADLLVAAGKVEFRHQQNEIWKDLRGLSQSQNALVVTATQADAASYDASLMQLKHFSEDKRKYAHVTAMYGLNQDPHGREKGLGVLRINELAIREGESNVRRFVHVLQNLRRGRPVLQSYF